MNSKFKIGDLVRLSYLRDDCSPNCLGKLGIVTGNSFKFGFVGGAFKVYWFDAEITDEFILERNLKKMNRRRIERE